MRTIKALACAAALAAGIATSMAQSNVYSLNVVGYYNLPCTADTLYCIANQLNTTNNSLASLIPAPPFNSRFYKWTGTWQEYYFDSDDTVWYPNGTVSLDPGEAGLFKSPQNTTLTFVGEVLQGQLNIDLGAPDINRVRSSKVPQAGAAAANLLYPSEFNDRIYKWVGTWKEHYFDSDDTVWYPSDPTFGVGEGMIIKKASTSTITTWTRNFTVQ